MEVLIRPIPHDPTEYAMGQCIFWPAANTDAISCTFNLGGFTPMTAVLRTLGENPDYFVKDSDLRQRHEESFCALSHGKGRRRLITTSRTPRWDDPSASVLKIFKTADEEGCRSLCLTHFAFILGRFPKAALGHSLRIAAQSWDWPHLKQVVVDVDARHFDGARELLRAIEEHHAYAKAHGVTEPGLVDEAEAGHPDRQACLAAELLARSGHKDRAVEALKWLVLSTLMRVCRILCKRTIHRRREPACP